MEKINVAELLKDCPQGMELDCTMYDNVKLDYVLEVNLYPIKIQTPEGQISLNKYGCYSNNKHAKCVIFPKGRTTWEGFQRPFKDGDVVYLKFDDYNIIAIFKKIDKEFCYYYVGVKNGNKLQLPDLKAKTGIFCTSYAKEITFATEYEKEILFNTIKNNGYYWNAETKTLEKLVEPKFKVGDKIVKRNSITNSLIVSSVSSEYYGLKLSEGIGVLPVSEQDDYELVPTKFDINTLVPFESRVLIRNDKNDKWQPTFWGFYDEDSHYYPYKTTGGKVRYCIPYKGNEWLLSKRDDCNDFYKTWE